MNYDIKNCFTGDIIYTAELDPKFEGEPESVLKGLAALAAIMDGVNLCFADLENAGLGDVNLCFADLRGAKLRDADLWGADLRGAKLPSAPIIKDIHKAVYAAASREGALNMTMWHACETTHCRAGWVVTLAGKEGAKLEAKIGTANAAYAIYAASDPEYWSKETPDFYAMDELRVMADMKRLAGVA